MWKENVSLTVRLRLSFVAQPLAASATLLSKTPMTADQPEILRMVHSESQRYVAVNARTSELKSTNASILKKLRGNH